MFNKKNYILFIIFLVLMIGAYLYVVPYKNWQEKEVKAGNNFLADVEVKSVDKIEATNKEGVVHVIKRAGGLWNYENGWPTEQILMDAMLEKLLNMATIDWEIASVNPDKKKGFGINDGIRVKLFSSGIEKGSFIIGNISSSYNSTYISRDNDDSTYLVKETLVRAFDTGSWQDRTIFDLNPELVDTVILKYSNQEIEFTNIPDSRGEVYWRTIKPYVARLNKEKIDEFISVIAKLEASGVPAQSEDGAGLSNPILQVQIKGPGIDETLIIGGAKEKEYFVKKVSSGQIFLIRDKQEEELAKQIRDLQ